MGQSGSCIQGNPDWSGSYQKASIKAQEAEIYDQIRKLATLSNAKDLQDLENFLNKKVNPTCPRHGTQAQQRSSPIVNTRNTLPYDTKFEEIYSKESSCKDINFNDNKSDSKPPSVKELIVPKSTCTVHGHKQEVHVCKVHGSPRPSNDSRKTSEPERKSNHQSPPTYKHPPQQKQPLKLNFPEFDEVSDEDSFSVTFTCPDFLANLILPSEEIESLDVLASVGVQSAKETIQRLEDRGESIVETFGVVLKHLQHGDWSTFCISTSRLCEDIKNVMRDYHLNSDVKDVETVKIKNKVTDALNKLTTYILSLNHSSSVETNHSILIPAFKILGEALHEMMEFLIRKELKVLIDCLKPETNQSSIRMATCALAEMSLSGNVMSKLIAQAGAVLPLLKICNVRKCKYLRPLALRVLTVICTTQEAVTHFENVSGFKTIMSLLAEESEEKVLCETVGLLAQILKQWSDTKCSIENKIGQDLGQLVNSLTETAKRSLSPEMFLLSAACLATLSVCNSKATSWLKSHAEEMRLLASSTKEESYV